MNKPIKSIALACVASTGLMFGSVAFGSTVSTSNSSLDRSVKPIQLAAGIGGIFDIKGKKCDRKCKLKKDIKKLKKRKKQVKRKGIDKWCPERDRTRASCEKFLDRLKRKEKQTAASKEALRKKGSSLARKRYNRDLQILKSIRRLKPRYCGVHLDARSRCNTAEYRYRELKSLIRQKESSLRR